MKIGDIPLYRRNDGAFVLHRVVGIKENGEYIMCGDNQFLLEFGITDKNIIGVARTLIIDGKETKVTTKLISGTSYVTPATLQKLGFDCYEEEGYMVITPLF